MNWKTIKKKYPFFIILVLFIGCMALFAMQPFSPSLYCETMEVNGGYGYLIKNGKDTVIYQPYIPAIGMRKPFASRVEAKRIGTIVLNKIIEKELPAISKKELEQAGIQ